MKKQGCVVGMGAVGPVHALGLAERGSLLAVCEIQPDRLAGFQSENSGLRRYSDFARALRDSEIDVVHICTPHYLHGEMAAAALQAGKDVVLEKPAAMSRRELERLRKQVAESERHICVMLQNRENLSVQKLKELLDGRGDLGKLLGGSARLIWSRDAAYYDQDPWRGRWSTEGGGLLINQAIHTLDLVQYLAGPAVRVTGSISNKTLRGAIEVEDTADAILETREGIRFCFYATNGSEIGSPMLLDFQMERGVYRYGDGRLYRITEDDCRVLARDGQSGPGKDDWGAGHRLEIGKFYEFLETGQGDYITLEDSVQATKTVFAIYDSARLGEPVEV